jgi:hypothetical protein
MSSQATSSYQSQTGDWNKPQIISFDSLFTTYSVDNIFESEKLQQMTPVLNKWRDSVSGHFSIKKLWDRPIIASYVCNSPIITRRTAHVELDATPGIIYKTYHPNSSSLHPMATTFRAPMAALIADTIFSEIKSP